jgi:hypothetical protein
VIARDRVIGGEVDENFTTEARRHGEMHQEKSHGLTLINADQPEVHFSTPQQKNLRPSA